MWRAYILLEVQHPTNILLAQNMQVHTSPENVQPELLPTIILKLRGAQNQWGASTNFPRINTMSNRLQYDAFELSNLQR